MAFCSACGTQTADGATLCANCSAAGSSVAVAAPSQTTSNGLADNIAGLLCYSPVGLFADVLFLVVEPYNKNKFIKFHAFQSLFAGLGIFCLAIAFMILGFILGLVPVVGWIIDLLMWLAFGIGNLVLWVMMMIKAYQMQTTKLPFVGDLAAKQAGL